MVTPISEIIFSGFVSKIVNNSVDASWIKIKKVIKNKKTEHQNIESQIYNVIVNALNQVTYNKYENNQDKVYQAAENLLLGCEKVKSDDIEIVRSGLQVLEKKVNNDVYSEFKRMIYDEISKKENVELYHTILLWLLERKNEYDRQEIEQLNQKLDEVIQILRIKEKASNVQYGDIKREIKSRTQEYADKWNQNMFLNDFDKRDENAGVNVKLREVYLEEHLPHYVWGENQKIFTDLKDLLKEYIYPYNENKMLLILGQPGIGKSTLITWITANFSDKVDDILVYRFASDLRDFDWQNVRLLNRILEKLGLDYKDLNRKTIILDGLDEVSINNRREVLDGLYDNLIYQNCIKEFSLIITCRENYVQERERIKGKYITLQPWDVIQIRSFCNVFQETTKINLSDSTKEKLFENREILGIPLILYMVLALNISIEKEGSIVDIYDKIFSLDGGIYDRCINNKKFADKHRIAEIKEQIHQISRDIAVWMFENNSIEANIPQREYQKICSNVMKEQQKNKEIEQDFLIGNFFKLVRYCEGIDTEKLYFIHRSIYEYFVAETIYSSIEYSMIKLSKESQKELARNIAELLKQGQITETINEYLIYKILKLYSKMKYEKEEFYQWWEDSVSRMMNVGMFYYTGKNIHSYQNIMDKEVQCFMNIIIILRTLSLIIRKKYIMEVVHRSQLEKYIRLKLINIRERSLNEVENLNLSKLDLSNLDLSGANLSKADLSEANLSESDISRVDLCRAKLVKTKLIKAKLIGVKLRQCNLTEADLTEANLTKADLTEADLRKSDLTKVNFRECKLQRADMRNAYLSFANLTGVKLVKANLKSAILIETILIGADLREANLSYATFMNVSLIGADLREANLIGVYLRETDLFMANLTGAIFDEIQIGYLKQEYNLNGVQVYRGDVLGSITYEEYCK